MSFLKRKPKTAVVLGCGPAGLFAAHALVQNNYEVKIFSRKRRSEMYGAQYLHRPIPGLSNLFGSHDIHYRLEGTTEEYRSKVYGRQQVVTSPEELKEFHPAWDIREAYHNAWSMYVDRIAQMDVDPFIPATIKRELAPDVFISSLPAQKMCLFPEDHRFASASVWAIGDAPERGVFCPVTDAKSFEVVLNGSPDTGWYRTSNVFGYRTAEWPGGKKPPLSGVSEVVKPISTDCRCHPDVIRVGRYGTWTKGVLSHHAYEKAASLL